MQQTGPLESRESRDSSVFCQQDLASISKQVELQVLDWPELAKVGLTVYLRRDDQVFSTYSGNKYYKLYYAIRNALQQGADALVSFGGPYSNHLHALAAAGKAVNLPTVGIVRGYEHLPLTPTLTDAVDAGMRLFFLNKKEYQIKNISHILPILNKAFSFYHIISEGGESLAGVRGCMTIGDAIAEQLPHQSYTLCSAVGTGTTFAGLIASSPRARCLGFKVLKGEGHLIAKIRYWLSLLGREERSLWQLVDGYHCGGYGKAPPELLDFMLKFEERNELILEPVYTAKMLWGIQKIAENRYWDRGSILVAVHSGGLQGRRGFSELF